VVKFGDSITRLVVRGRIYRFFGQGDDDFAQLLAKLFDVNTFGVEKEIVNTSRVDEIKRHLMGDGEHLHATVVIVVLAADVHCYSVTFMLKAGAHLKYNIVDSSGVQLLYVQRHL